MSFTKQRESTFNSILIGLAIGIIIPVLAYSLLDMLSIYMGERLVDSTKHSGPMFRKRTVGLFSVCLNLIPFAIFNRKKFNLSLRGTVLATLIWGAIWIYLFFGELYGDS